MQEQKLALWQEPCNYCGGEKWIPCRGIEISEGEFSGCVCGLDNCPKDCPTCEGDHSEPCPDCQLNGIATGLKWPMLVERCKACSATGARWTIPDPKIARFVRIDCPKCQGTGYVPKPEAERMVAMMEWLQDKWYRFSVVKNDPLGWIICADNFYEELSKCKYRQGIGPTLCAALAAACEAVAEVK